MADRLSVSSLRIAGIMTGTSCDGLDIACVEFDGTGLEPSWTPLWSASAPYPASLRRRVLAVQAPGFRQDVRDWLKLHRDLGQWYATTLARIVSRHRGRRPHVLANHGQTIAHYPADHSTLQIGDPSLIARATGLTVACSFREGDIAAGGQGAPLVPRFHALLARPLSRSGKALAIHNLGGISNLSYFARGWQRTGSVFAFDTGPGNVWIDAAAALASKGRLTMDTGGKLARLGRADATAVRTVLAHPYFGKPAPKSTGRNEFPFALLRARTRAKGADLVATATEITIESIARSYENAILHKGLPLDEIYFCGGGAKNPSILDGLKLRLPRVAIRSLADAGFDPQLVEAQAFAYCGFLALVGSPLGGSWTGARGFGPPAHIIPGENWAEVASKLRGSRSRR